MSMILSFAAAVAASAPASAAPPQAPPPVVSAVPATPPAPQPALDPAALAEARGLLHDIGFEEQIDQDAREAAESTFETTITELQRHYGTTIPAELRARVHAVMLENLAQVVDEMRPTALEDAARVYARFFTAAELQEIRRIQTNPVMAKMQRLAPQLMNELMQIGIAASARHMPDMMARLQQVYEQWRREQAALRPHVG